MKQKQKKLKAASWTKGSLVQEVKRGEVCCVKDVHLLIVCLCTRKNQFRRLQVFNTRDRSAAGPARCRADPMVRSPGESLVPRDRCLEWDMEVSDQHIQTLVDFARVCDG